MKGILFDLDGVLVDVSESYNLTIKMVVERLAGRMVSDGDIEAYRSRGGLNNDWDLTECIIKEAGVPADRTTLVALFQKIYRGKNFGGLIRKETPLVHAGVLRELRKTRSLGIVTGRPRDEADFTLRRFRLAPEFSVLVTMDELPPGRGKPDPLGIRLALDSLGLREAVYVGDTVDDMQAARSAGLPAVGIVRGPCLREERIKALKTWGASAVLADVNDILEVL
jgi:HAD superfamily phosphatase